MKKPNFFIVGAPKCGTTALSEYLKSHPQVFFSDTKEPNYFNTDFSESFRSQNARRLLRNEKDYLSLFRQATEKHRAIGEGTVWYLYSQEAMKNIQIFNPNSKIIVMLRNPVDLAYSLYRQQVYSFHERVDDFETAWRLQERRERGESLPRNCLEPKVLLYREICLLGSQLNRLYKVFPKDQVATIFFEDFIGRTREIYEDTLVFLGLELDDRKFFPPVNVNKTHRFKLINYWLVNRPPLWLFKTTDTIKRLFGVKSLGIYRIVKKCNTKKGLRKPLDTGSRQMLHSAFSNDIDLLESLTGKDLRHWK